MSDQIRFGGKVAVVGVITARHRYGRSESVSLLPGATLIAPEKFGVEAQGRGARALRLLRGQDRRADPGAVRRF